MGTDGINLQSTLSSSTADTVLQGKIEGPHHPITCAGGLYVDDDNTIRCDHSSSSPENPRNQALFDATIAILLMEIACAKY